jgi:hypothetical protein
MRVTLLCGLAASLSLSPASLPAQQPATTAPPPTFAPPVRLEANGSPIEIGVLSSIAHAGPWLGDFTGDGKRDLLVGDFPGYFWLFENKGTDKAPSFSLRGKLQAGGVDAKTPVY